MNEGSIICTTGFYPKEHLTIWDTLLPSRSSVMMSHNIGGNIILPMPIYKQIYVHNSKSGTNYLYDLRNQKSFKIDPMKSEKFNCGILNKTHDTLFTGSRDGQVQIWNVSNNFSIKERIDAFKHAKVKKIILAENGGLYACSRDGVVKLLRVYKTSQ